MSERVIRTDRGIRATTQGGWAAVERRAVGDGQGGVRVVFRLIEDFNGKGAKGAAIWAARSNREFA